MENREINLTHLTYGHKLTDFGATVNKTDFAVSITIIQLENPTPVIKLRLYVQLCTKRHSNVLQSTVNSSIINYKSVTGYCVLNNFIGGKAPNNSLTSDHIRPASCRFLKTASEYNRICHFKDKNKSNIFREGLINLTSVLKTSVRNLQSLKHRQ